MLIAARYLGNCRDMQASFVGKSRLPNIGRLCIWHGVLRFWRLGVVGRRGFVLARAWHQRAAAERRIHQVTRSAGE